MDAARKTAIVDKYLEACTRGDASVVREIYADNAVVEDPVGTEAHHGIDAIVAFYEQALQNGARMERIGNVRCAGNAAAFCFDVHVGGMKIEVLDVFEFDAAGKVVSMKAYWGPENVVQQQQ